MTFITTDQPSQEITVSLACLTDKGRARPGNEDAFVIADLDAGEITSAPGELLTLAIGTSGLLIAVADGMGGAQAGEVASRLAVEQHVRRLRAPVQAGTVEERLRDGIKSANRAIRHASKAFFPNSSAEMDDVFERIAVELRHQYAIGYKPSTFTPDGKWHRVKVKVTPPRGLPHLFVRNKDGYYALTNPR